MKKYKGLTKERIITVKESNAYFNKAKIQSSQDAYEYIKPFWSDDIEIYESFFILLLNRSNNTIGYAKISQGGITGTIVDKKIIAKYAIDTLASGIILAHNHPSGNEQPSDADQKITDDIKGVLNIIDVTLLDHIILTKDTFTSFADDGLL
jgi:DNA repair protein RadC